MKEQNRTDNEMISRIKQSLEQYEEAYIQGSWESFLQQRRTRNRRFFLRIASAAAACLLLGYLGFVSLPAGKKEVVQPLVEQTKQLQPDSSVRIYPPEKTALAAMVNPSNHPVKQSPTGKALVSAFSRPPKVAGTIEKQPIGERPSSTLTEPAGKEKVLAGESHGNTQATDTLEVTRKVAQSGTKVVYAQQQNAKTDQKQPMPTSRKVRFGINFSPGVTSAPSAGSLNFMGGVSADISLSSKLALSTGLQLENQNQVKSLPGIVASSGFPQNQTRTKLINLDLPLNLTWKFASEKTHAYYVSAGLSSLVYLKQQNRNTTYSQDLIPVSSLINGVEVKTYSVADQVSVTENRVTPSQTFDFAGRINFMVGFEKQLSDKLFLHIEPYTKIPTSGQAAGSLNHATSGINFKISF